MATIEELVDTAPAASAGRPATLLGAGYRWALQLADPLAGSGIVWHDLSGFVTGIQTAHETTLTSKRANARTATVELKANDDSLAVWNEDTSALFGTHVQLGHGLLIRLVLFRVAGGSTVEWWPIFTMRVSKWGDDSSAFGEIRRHRVECRDTSADLTNQPVGASTEGEGWYERAGTVLGWAGWEFGALLYGAVLDDNEDQVLPMPEREEQQSALSELDVTLDPAGLVWYTNRKGQLVARPMPGDTFHADLFDDGAIGDQWTDPTPVTFAWNASTTGGGNVAYAEGSGGFEDDERGVINHVSIKYPEGSYDDDSATSIQRSQRKTLQASWIVENDDVADVILARNAFASMQARPLVTSVDLEGFWPAVPRLELYHPVTIVHCTKEGRATVTAEGRVRSLAESFIPEPFQWTVEVGVEIDSYTTELGLLPVEDLAVDTLEDQFVEFSWSNPDGQPVEPTETWIRMRPDSLIWQEHEYPITSMAYLGLTPDTSYEFDVRLVRRVDGLVTNVSPTRTVEFTTPPAPWIDDDGNLHIPEPDPGCHMEWELQSSPDGEDPWTTERSGEAPSGGLIEADPSWYDAVSFWRLRTREVCGGTPGEWWYTPLGVGECRTSASLEDEESIFADESLVCYVPEICQPARIIEAVSQTEGHHGANLASIGVDDDGDLTLNTGEDFTGQGTVAFGTVPDLRGLVDGDVSASCDVTLGEQATTRLWDVPGLRLSAVLSGDGWKPRAVAFYENGEAQVVGDDELDLDTKYRVMARHERATGTLELLVDGALVNDVTAGEDRPLRNRNMALGVDWSVMLPPKSRITNCAAWNTLVTPGVAGLELDWDATVSDSIDYTIGTMIPPPRANYVEWLDLVAGVPIDYGPGPGLTHFWPSRTINGRPAMEGDGGNSTALPNASIADLAGRAQIAYGDVLLIAAVFQADDPATTRGIIRKAGASNAQGMWGLGWTEDGELELAVRDDSTHRYVRGEHDVTQPTVAIAILDWRTTSRQAILRANGVQLDSLSYTGSTTQTIGERVLEPAQYYNALNSNRGDGAFGQFRFYRRTNGGTFSNDEIAQIEAELMTKWGISS